MTEPAAQYMAAISKTCVTVPQIKSVAPVYGKGPRRCRSEMAHLQRGPLTEAAAQYTAAISKTCITVPQIKGVARFVGKAPAGGPAPGAVTSPVRH